MTFAENERRNFIIAAALAFAAAAPIADHPYFEKFLVGIHPLIAVGAIFMGGGVSLWLLYHVGWRKAPTATNNRIKPAIMLAAVFAVPVILADMLLRFPETINAALPSSLLFYPAIAFIAEGSFHLIPLAALAAVTRLITRKTQVPIWIIFPVALIEPCFQLQAVIPGAPLNGVSIYTGAHVFAFGVVQLMLFRRYGFLAMLSMRIAYYLLWHIGWGALRLQLLF